MAVLRRTLSVLRKTEKKTVSTAFFAAIIYDTRPNILFRATVAGMTLLENDVISQSGVLSKIN